jgi:hypothetical protein
VECIEEGSIVDLLEGRFRTSWRGSMKAWPPWI